MTLEIGELVPTIMKQVQEWKQLHPHIQSPDQCPAIANTSQIRSKIAESTLTSWLDGKTSIRQLARYLNQDILSIAQRLDPLIQRGDLQLQPAPVLSAHTDHDFHPQHLLPRIVCIDDGASIRKIVELILNEHGYEATAISNPLKAMSLVFQLRPDLILCDISMPELDGYEICAMLRKSTAFRQTPIVMLTGRDGFIDRVRARMVGATDYLTKPFGENELLTLMEKYIGPGNPNHPAPEKLLAEALENELEIGIPRFLSPPSASTD
jgi:twitching motility two-component system response regulator PilG